MTQNRRRCRTSLVVDHISFTPSDRLKSMLCVYVCVTKNFKTVMESTCFETGRYCGQKAHFFFQGRLRSIVKRARAQSFGRAAATFLCSRAAAIERGGGHGGACADFLIAPCDAYNIPTRGTRRTCYAWALKTHLRLRFRSL